LYATITLTGRFGSVYYPSKLQNLLLRVNFCRLAAGTP
jgi:hypothetical protein